MSAKAETGQQLASGLGEGKDPGAKRYGRRVEGQSSEDEVTQASQEGAPRASGSGSSTPRSDSYWPLDDDSYQDFGEEDLSGDDFGDDEELEAEEVIDEQGRRHVRRAAPEGPEEILEAEQPRTTGLPHKLEAWRRRSATGAVLTAFAMGLQEAFEPEKKEPAIIMQTSGEPPKDLPVEAQLEQLGPRQSTINVRPWLLSSTEPPDGTSDGPEET